MSLKIVFFACNCDQFNFDVVSFGLCSAPRVFQKLMSVIFQGISCFVTAYFVGTFIYLEEEISIYLGELLFHTKIFWNILNADRLKNSKLFFVYQIL